MDLWTKTCENPVFVIGAPRSGTSIVAWSLVQHGSGFWASNESHILATLLNTGCVENAFERAKQTHKDGLLPQEGVEIQEFLQYLGLGINALFTSRSQGKRWIDHTPSYTRIVDTIAVMFPGASFIHILRDGREVVNSMTHFLDIPKSNLKQAPAWVDFTQACKTWRMYTRAAMDFCARHPERCLTVVYRELVDDPQDNFRKIQQFLRVPHDDEPVNYFTSQRINSSFKSSSQPAGNGRMRAANPCAEWSPKERLIFYWEAGPYLLEYGFATQEELDSLVAPK